MAFFIAAAVLFLALLAGTAIEFPRLGSEERDGIELSQAMLAVSPPCRCRGLSASGLLPWDYSCASGSFVKSPSSVAGSKALCHPARNPA
jgi:hypothetical protein